MFKTAQFSAKVLKSCKNLNCSCACTKVCRHACDVLLVCVSAVGGVSLWEWERVPATLTESAARAGLSALDPLLVAEVRDRMLVPPSHLPYELSQPNVKDPSVGQATLVLEILRNKVCSFHTLLCTTVSCHYLGRYLLSCHYLDISWYTTACVLGGSLDSCTGWGSC